MLIFPKLVELRRQEIQNAENDDQFFAEWVFHEWRGKSLDCLYRLMRLCGQAKARARSVELTGKTPQWCNAAALILETCGEDVQDLYLRGPSDFKEALIAAVIADDGVSDENGRWRWLPVL